MGGSKQKKSQNNKRMDKWVEKAEMSALVAGNCAQKIMLKITKANKAKCKCQYINGRNNGCIG